MYLQEDCPLWIAAGRGRSAAAGATCPRMGGWDADPYDDGDPHYLPEDELVAPSRVPGWTRGAPAAGDGERVAS